MRHCFIESTDYLSLGNDDIVISVFEMIEMNSSKTGVVSFVGKMECRQKEFQDGP